MKKILTSVLALLIIIGVFIFLININSKQFPKPEDYQSDKFQKQNNSVYDIYNKSQVYMYIHDNFNNLTTENYGTFVHELASTNSTGNNLLATRYDVIGKIYLQFGDYAKALEYFNLLYALDCPDYYFYPAFTPSTFKLEAGDVMSLNKPAALVNMIELYTTTSENEKLCESARDILNKHSGLGGGHYCSGYTWLYDDIALFRLAKYSKEAESVSYNEYISNDLKDVANRFVEAFKNNDISQFLSICNKPSVTYPRSRVETIDEEGSLDYPDGVIILSLKYKKGSFYNIFKNKSDWFKKEYISSFNIKDRSVIYTGKKDNVDACFVLSDKNGYKLEGFN